MFTFTLPQRTLVIGGRQRCGKSVTAMSLAYLHDKEYSSKVLFITDQPDQIKRNFLDINIDYKNIDLISNEYSSPLDITKYRTVIIEIGCYTTNLKEMRFSSWYPLSNSIINYLENINNAVQIPFVIVTAYLDPDLIDMVR